MTTILKSMLLLFCTFLIYVLSLALENEDDKTNLGFLWTSIVLVSLTIIGIILSWFL